MVVLLVLLVAMVVGVERVVVVELLVLPPLKHPNKSKDTTTIAKSAKRVCMSQFPSAGINRLGKHRPDASTVLVELF